VIVAARQYPNSCRKPGIELTIWKDLIPEYSTPTSQKPKSHLIRHKREIRGCGSQKAGGVTFFGIGYKFVSYSCLSQRGDSAFFFR